MWLRTGAAATALFGSDSPSARARTRRLISTGVLFAIPVSYSHPQAGWLVASESIDMLLVRAASEALDRFSDAERPRD